MIAHRAAPDDRRRSSPAEGSDAAAGGPAIDFAFLDRQTAGDAALAAELLDLFDRQSAALLARLSEPGATAIRRADLAHTLRGSAASVGAGAAARAAQALEALLARGASEGPALEEAFARLAAAIGEARAAIAARRG
jgi:HPt (histidine-containing phosphotransfer) domain-containing protein